MKAGTATGKPISYYASHAAIAAIEAARKPGEAKSQTINRLILEAASRRQ